MSPEYAIDGKFSVKSDVFSFGVLLLEMVSRKKNRSFNHTDHHHNLLGHVSRNNHYLPYSPLYLNKKLTYRLKMLLQAWLLWYEGKAIELMDETFKDSCVESQVLRCIHVGLLCVQKFSEDRPTMNSVVFMLANELAKLPQPKQPGFFIERSSNNVNEGSTTSRHDKESYNSNNGMTITLDGR